MVWIDDKTIGLCWPALTHLFIGGEALQGFESLGKVISHEKIVEMFFELPVVLVVGCVHCGLFERAIRPLFLPVGPGMIRLRKAVFNTIVMAHTTKDMSECIAVSLPVCELNAVISQNCVNPIRHRSHEVTEELGSYRLGRRCLKLYIREFAGAIDRDKEMELAIFRAYLGDIKVAVSRG